jgi:hypothetical protein
MQAFFVGTAKTPLELVLFLALVLAAFSVLPLGVVAIFRPRLAAHGIGLCWLVLMVVGYGSVPWGTTASWSLTDLLEPLLLYFPPTIGIVALLLYGAGPAPGDGISEGSGAKNRDRKTGTDTYFPVSFVSLKPQTMLPKIGNEVSRFFRFFIDGLYGEVRVSDIKSNAPR